MKKIIALLLCLCMAFSAVALTSCDSKDNEEKKDDQQNDAQGGEPSGETAAPVVLSDLMASIVAGYPDIPNEKKLYLASATEEENEDQWLDPDYAGFLFTGNYEACAEWDLLEDFAIRLPDGKSAFEIHLFKVKEAKDVDAVKALCQSRIDQINASDIKLYDAEGFAKVFGNAEVYSIDNYVFLLITTGNDAAKNAINAAFGK